MNGLRFYDRLLAEETTTPSGRLTVGRLVIINDSPLISNGIPVSTGAYLLPSSEEKARLSISDNQDVVIDNYWYNQFPEKNERDSLRAIGSRLQKLEENGATWDQWIKVPPLIISNTDKLRLLEFDQALIKHIWHLQWVSEHPLTQLTINIERMPVWQARRIPTKAYDHLSSHTEDWEYPKPRSVVPRRILSTIPEDLFDFYENRLAAKLLSEIYIYLSGRLSEIQRIGEIKVELELGTHWRRDRVYSLIGDAFNIDDIQKNIEFLKEPLEILYGRVLGMFDKPLFQAIPAQSRNQVPPVVRSTNILSNDRHYRFVNILWREYLRDHHERPKNNNQLQQDLHELCKNFDRYCMLLITRSLYQLGYLPVNSTPLERGKRFQLANKSIAIELEWETTGCIGVFFDQQLILRIVPIISSLTNTNELNDLIHQLSNIMGHWSTNSKSSLKRRKKNTDKSIIRTLVLYPGNIRERQKLPPNVQRLVNTPGNDIASPLEIGLIPVSSYELGSTERVARALRWSITGKNILSYPPEITVSEKIKDNIIHDKEWIKSEKGSTIAKLLRPPDEREYLKHQDDYRNLQGGLTNLGTKAQQELYWLEQYWDQIRNGVLRLASFRICPLCGKEVRVENFHISDGETFSCECREPSCQVTWGKRYCNKCGKPYPFIDFMKLNYPLDNSHSDWVDRQFGMDILAVYCPNFPHTFICPSCGECGQTNQGDSEVCTNCRLFRKIINMETVS